MRLLTVGFVLILSVTLVLTTGACGGGGGGGGVPTGPAALFTGPYHYVAFAGNDGPPAGWSWWGSMTGNGAGTVTSGVLNWNNLGAIGATPFAPFPYTVDANRRMTWGAGTALELVGGIASDGRVGCLASSATGAFPGVAFICRQAGTFSTASLNAVYHVVALSSVPTWDYAYWGTVSFDGGGGTIISVTENRSGAITVQPPYFGSYTVAANGTVDFSFLGFWDMRGGMLAGGEFLVLGGGTTATNPPMFCVLFPRSTSASAATLTGPYHVASLTADNGGTPHFTSWTGTANSDGVGIFAFNPNGTENRDGAISSVPGGIVTHPYAVAASGALDFSAGTYLGGVSPNGNFAAFAGGTAAASTPECWILIR